MEKAVQQQLLKYLEINNLLSNYQFGYQKKKSTQSAAVLLTDNIRKSIDKRDLVESVFIVLTNAFDPISHELLLDKMATYGIREREKENDWFTDYLFKRSQRVALDNTLSTEFHLTCGVPQGSILWLFDIYPIHK